MIITNDIKIKERKPAPDDLKEKQEKLIILTTGKFKVKGFNPKNKGKPRDKRIITTSNIEDYQKRPRKKKK